MLIIPIAEFSFKAFEQNGNTSHHFKTFLQKFRPFYKDIVDEKDPFLKDIIRILLSLKHFR